MEIRVHCSKCGEYLPLEDTYFSYGSLELKVDMCSDCLEELGQEMINKIKKDLVKELDNCKTLEDIQLVVDNFR